MWMCTPQPCSQPGFNSSSCQHTATSLSSAHRWCGWCYGRASSPSGSSWRLRRTRSSCRRCRRSAAGRSTTSCYRACSSSRPTGTSKWNSERPFLCAPDPADSAPWQGVHLLQGALAFPSVRKPRGTGGRRTSHDLWVALISQPDVDAPVYNSEQVHGRACSGHARGAAEHANV